MAVFVDIGICLIFAIALIVGAICGMCRQFSRPLVGLVSFAGAIVLVVVLYPLFANAGFMLSFIGKVSGWFSKPMYTQVVTNAEELTAAISGSYLSVLSGMAENMFARMEAMLAPTGLELTIGNFFGKIIVNVIVEFAMWLIIYLAIKYLLFGVKYLLKKITSVVVFKSIDKIFGIIWSVAITYVIVIGIVFSLFEMILSRFLGDVAVTMTNFVAQTTVLKFFHNTNLLGSFLSNLLGWPLFVMPA